MITEKLTSITNLLLLSQIYEYLLRINLFTIITIALITSDILLYEFIFYTI